MILYLKKKNPKDTTRKLIEPISEFNKVSRCKINTQKSFAGLYTKNKNQKQKVRNQSHLPLKEKQ